jgi:hypothetical protein
MRAALLVLIALAGLGCPGEASSIKHDRGTRVDLFGKKDGGTVDLRPRQLDQEICVQQGAKCGSQKCCLGLTCMYYGSELNCQPSP